MPPPRTPQSFEKLCGSLSNLFSSHSMLGSIFNIKNAALACLVLQNTFLVVFMHYSRVLKGPMYYSSTAVATMELVKFVTCISVIAYEKAGVMGLFKAINEEVVKQPIEIIKLSVPSLLYVVQNNLLYYALSHLDAATYQVGYQVKILTTAVFSVLMLGKKLSLLQWVSLFILTIGVSMAQISASGGEHKENTTSGFVAVLVAACTSGFSGVYFEKVLKSSSGSIWIRNVQMGISSIILAFGGIYFSGELTGVMENGYFYGYTWVVWLVIILQAVGGLVVAIVVKYADNILKGFAASFSIITSCILCYFFFDFHPTFIFLIGAILVNVSMYMYSYQPTHKPKTDDETDSGSNNKNSNNSDSGSSRRNILGSNVINNNASNNNNREQDLERLLSGDNNDNFNNNSHDNNSSSINNRLIIEDNNNSDYVNIYKGDYSNNTIHPSTTGVAGGGPHSPSHYHHRHHHHHHTNIKGNDQV